MVCVPVQVVWHKFARYWDVEMREVPMAPGRYAMDTESMLERVDENTIMVVPTFGVTYTGAYEPVDLGPDVCAYVRGGNVLVVVPVRNVPAPAPAAGWTDVLGADLGVGLYER